MSSSLSTRKCHTNKENPVPKDAVTLTFTKDKETKGTFRYAEDGDEPVVGTVYVRKAAAEKLGNPEKITVSIQAK
jgi:hypothetical protein